MWDIFDNAELICLEWAEMFLKQCVSQIWEARKKAR